MTDLCLTCQQNTSKLLRSANLPDNEKSQCVLAQQEHLNCVQTEREFYRNTCSESKNNLQRLADTIEFDEPHDPCSIDAVIRYSFDFAQQIHIPSNPMQLGPIYFKTPRKCGIFGVMSEAVPQQVNYLIDEASDVGKGANSTISYVHHYFQNHGLGETCVHLHADNCSGQNKNNCFLWYQESNKSASWLNHLFVFNCWTYQVWPRSLLWNYQEIVQSYLYFFSLRICRDGRVIQHCGSKQSTTCWDTRWQSYCASVRLVSIPRTVLLSSFPA